jgi:tetratricopeptide (TPR) repeat protein
VTANGDASALTVWFWRQMATWSHLLKRDELALEYRARIAAARPGDASALASVAHLQAQQGRRPDAVANLKRALSLDPGRADAWFNLGYLQQEEQRHDDAIASFERALALDDKLDRAWYGKALSLIKSGRAEDAIEPLQRNVKLQPLSPYGLYQLAHVYHRLQRRDEVATTIRRLATFEPQVARQLERETGVVVGVKTL